MNRGALLEAIAHQGERDAEHLAAQRLLQHLQHEVEPVEERAQVVGDAEVRDALCQVGRRGEHHGVLAGHGAGWVDQYADQVTQVGDLDLQRIESVGLRRTEHRQVDRDRALQVDIHQARRQLAQPVAVIRRVRLGG